ncbi:MAG: hypothetical protein Q7O04_01215, partial [Candidatus Omnitrophota bacterium]|nr:hypothetical protein [Candidatus Omnitrophota bacterium]
MSSKNFLKNGNGKIDRTPTPQGIRKIKRVSFEAFLRLKKLVKVFKIYDSIVHKRYRKKSTLPHKKPKIVVQNHARGYEPSKISNVYNSPLWQ